ncbi:MAG TPA: tetratricopeptide repeat protein [Kofleriaceae bacterium]|nr:tetratricopeptide repeat protein [Kofleriaceae bacterium]
MRARIGSIDPLAFNKNKVMETARKYVEKGQVDRAIKEYLRVVQEDPKDVRVWLKVGDLYAKKGAKQEATETYLKVAKFYSEQGFYLKAVAVYKQILKLDARLVEVNLKLAELYRQLGLLSDAMQHFEMVAAHFHREGKTAEALATVRQLVDLDPENVATRIKLAELYSKEQMVAEAVTEFSAACSYLRAHNRQDDFIKVAERLLWHKPESHELNRELATLYLRRNDPRRALQKLQQSFKADARDVETLALLAQAFQALDQKGKTVSVLKELARVLDEDGKKEQASDVHRKILMYVPDEPDSRAYLGDAAPPPVPVPAAPSLPPPRPPQRDLVTSSDLPDRRVGKVTGSMPLISDDPDLSDPELVLEEDDEDDFAADLSMDESAVRYDTGSLAGEAHAEEIIKILTETDVYVKYGLHQKAIDHLKRVFELDPDNVEARERLKEIYVSQGRDTEALVELLALAEQAASADPDQAEAYLRELLAIDGTYQPALDLARRFRLEIVSGPEVEIVEDFSDAIELDPDALEDGSIAPVDDELDFADMGFGDDGVVSNPAQVIPSIHDEDDSFEFAALAGEDEASDEYEFALDDASEPGRGSGTGSGVTQEVSLDQVEDMIALEAEVDDLGFESEFSMGSDPGGLAEASPAPAPPPARMAPPVFDPRAAREFDADLDPEVDFATADAHTFDAEPMADVDSVHSDFGGTQRAPASFLAEPPTEADKQAFEPSAARQEAPRPETLEQTVDGDFEGATGSDYDDPSMGTSLEDDLDEADFFISQGLYGEARDILVSLLEAYPNHPLVTAKLQDVDAMNVAANGALDTPAPELDTEDLVEVEPQSMDTFAGAPDMTGASRPAVLLERPIEDEDADTHYDLGLAYKEMGIYAEAIKAFEKVLHNETRAVQCFLMIGLCHREQGNLSEAVHQFKQGLHISTITEREKHSVYYEIGAAYEALDDPAEAVYYYEMLHKKDSGFRDVGRRLANLQARMGRNGDSDTRRTGRAADDADAALDSLLAESDFRGK